MPQGQTILLVDDSENDLALMRIAFKKAKCNLPLHEVRNGEDAIAYLRGEGLYGNREKFPLPTIMLLDLNMPRKDGFAVLAWVRAQPLLKRLTIMVMTASARTSDIDRVFDLGASSFLVKPTSLETLAAMVACLASWIKINHFASIHAEKIPHENRAEAKAEK
jgi:CheY-like chemotaxis protein